MRLTDLCLGTLLLLACLSSLAAGTAGREDRVAARDAARFLGLSSEQVTQLLAARADYGRLLQPLAIQADQLAQPQTGQLAGDRALVQVCRQARELEAAYRAKLRLLLTPPQLASLEQLDAAFRLLPIIESAQATGLLDDKLSAAPGGLPSGSISVDYSWRRVPATLLPGCSATKVYREVDVEHGSAGRRPPN